MKTILSCMAALALTIAPAMACGFDKTAGHHTMSVASLDEDARTMSTTDDAIAEKTAVDEISTGSIEAVEDEKAE